MLINFRLKAIQVVGQKKHGSQRGTVSIKNGLNTTTPSPLLQEKHEKNLQLTPYQSKMVCPHLLHTPLLEGCVPAMGNYYLHLAPSLQFFVGQIPGQKLTEGSHLEQRIISSAQIAILQISLSGRSLIYGRNSVKPRMEPCVTPELTQQFCKEVSTRTT